MMLTTVGRGGDGQRIRDEILNIMHRNHIPERKGLWMEVRHDACGWRGRMCRVWMEGEDVSRIMLPIFWVRAAHAPYLLGSRGTRLAAGAGV